MKATAALVALAMIASAQASFLPENENLLEPSQRMDAQDLIERAHSLVQLDPESLLKAAQTDLLGELFLETLGQEPEEPYGEEISFISATNAGQSGGGGHDLFVSYFEDSKTKIALHNSAGDNQDHVFETEKDVLPFGDINDDGFIDLAYVEIDFLFGFGFATGDASAELTLKLDFFDMKTQEELGHLEVFVASSSERTTTTTGGSSYLVEIEIRTVEEVGISKTVMESYVRLEQTTPDVNIVVLQYGEEKMSFGGHGIYQTFEEGTKVVDVRIDGIPSFTFLADSTGDDESELQVSNLGNYEYTQDRAFILFDGSPNIVIGETESAIINGATGDVMYNLDAEFGGFVTAGPTEETYIWNERTSDGFKQRVLGAFEGPVPWLSESENVYVGYYDIRGDSDREFLVIDTENDDIRVIKATGEEIWTTENTEIPLLSAFPEESFVQMANGEPYLMVIDEANGIQYRFESLDRETLHYQLDVEEQRYLFVDSIDDNGELDFFAMEENETANGTIYTAKMFAGQNGGLLWEKPIALVDGVMDWSAETMKHARGDGGAGELILNYYGFPFSGTFCNSQSCHETSSSAEFARVAVLDGASGILLQEFKAFDEEQGLNEDVGRAKQTSLGEKVEKDMPAPFAFLIAGIAALALMRRK